MFAGAAVMNGLIYAVGGFDGSSGRPQNYIQAQFCAHLL